MADNKTQIVITAKDETRAAISSAQAGMQQLADAASKVGMGGFGAGIAALASGGALTNLVTGTIQWAAAMDDLAEKTGASVENLSGLAKVASISGQSIEVVENGLIRLSKALAGADEEAKGAGRALEALGLDPQKLRAMDSAEALKVVADRMSEFRDGTGKTALALDIFGKSGAQLLPFLKDLSEQQSIAGKLTAEQAAAAEALEKAWRRTTSEGGAVAKGLVMDLIPAFAYAVDVVKGAKVGIAQFGASLAVVANDVKVAFEIIAAAGANVTSPGKAKDEIAAILEQRARFVEAANEDMKDRMLAYKSTYDEVQKILAGGGEKKPAIDYTSKGSKEAKVKAEKPLSPEDAAYGGYQGAYRDFVAAVKRVTDNAQAAADTDVQIEEEKQKRIQDIVGQTTSFKIESIRKEIEAANKALEEGLISNDVFKEFAEQKEKDIKRLTEGAKDDFKDLQRAIEGWGRSSADAIVEFAFTGKMAVGDLVASILKDLAKMAVYKGITEPLFKEISGIFSGGGKSSGSSGGSGFLGDVAGFFGNMFGGFRATGGPVTPGNYYVVGENGPEILVPNAAGTVIPNGGGQGGGTTSNIVVNVDASGSAVAGDKNSAAELGRRIESAVRAVIVTEKRPGGLLGVA